MDAQHHLRVLGEITIGMQRALAVSGRQHLGQCVPGSTARVLARSTALEEQQIDDDLGAARGHHRSLRHADGAHQVRHAGDVGAALRIDPVHGEARHTKAAKPPGFNRSIERAMKYSCRDSPSLPDGRRCGPCDR